MLGDGDFLHARERHGDRTGRRLELERVGGNGRLLVIGAGKIPPNPSEVLGSARMKELLEAISREAIVIIDAPPLIPVTDAAVLAHSTDGAIVVATVGKTTFEVLGKALSNLDRAGARALGIVLNRVPRRGSGAAYYGYQYHGDYYRVEKPEDEAAQLLASTPSSEPVHTEPAARDDDGAPLRRSAPAIFRRYPRCSRSSVCAEPGRGGRPLVAPCGREAAGA